MYKCPLCEMQSEAFNVLCSSHYRKHKHELSLPDYKRQLLIANDRIPPVCPVCGLETTIPKGEKDFPKFHKACYFQKIGGVNNPNYGGGKLLVYCEECKKPLHKHVSHLQRDKKFCSTSCAQTFYGREENWTPAIKERHAQASVRMKEMMQNPCLRQKIAKGQARAFKDGRSQFEKDVYSYIVLAHPDAIFSHQIDYYVVDIFIPSLNQVVEAQGDYWHSLPDQASKDRGKLLFLTNKGYRVSYVWEHEWENAVDKNQLLSICLNRVSEYTLPTIDLMVIGGVSGSGKSWVCSQLSDTFAYVEYDKTPKKDLYNSIFIAGISGKTVLVDMHNGISTFIRRAGGRFNISLVCIDESLDIIQERLTKRGGVLTDSIIKRTRRIKKLAQQPYCLFSGSSQEVLSFLKSR